MANGSNPFSTILDVMESGMKKAVEFKTIADDMFDKLGIKKQSNYPSGQMDVGRAWPQTQTINYTAANEIDQKIDNIKRAGEDIVTQVKGLFNLAYEGSTEKTTTAADSAIGNLPQFGLGNPLVLLAIAAIVILLVKK